MVNPDKTFGRLGNRLFQLAYVFGQMKRGVIEDIYVQNPVFFDDYREELRQMLGAPTEQIDYVGIHVRRGDYVNNPFYVDLSKTDYYEKAMGMFPGAKFLVFSDDIEWCGKQSIFDECDFSFGTELEDMTRLAMCKGIIMANSSFSWWASYLSNAKVIAPKAWYSDNVERTKCLKEWTRL